MKFTRLRGPAALAAAAMIWGSAFVAQSIGMENLEPFTYNGIRTLMGAGVLLPIVLLKDLKARKSAGPGQKAALGKKNKKTWLCGALLGAALCVASNLQQTAFVYTTPGKIAFITALYMLLVPLFGLPFGKKAPPVTWLGVLTGGVGMYFLCFPAGGAAGFNRGDLLSLGCAAAFAVQILLVERFAGENDAVKLSFVQFLTSGALSCVPALLFETPRLANVRAAIWPLLYAGVLSCGVAYTLQVVGQKHTNGAFASLIMCTESVFAVLGAALVLRQVPTGRELIGCALMLGAVIAVQLAGLREPKNTPKARDTQSETGLTP